MGKKGKRAKSGKLTSREVLKRLDALTEKVQAELEVADLFVPRPPNPDCPLCFFLFLTGMNALATCPAVERPFVLAASRRMIG